MRILYSTMLTIHIMLPADILIRAVPTYRSILFYLGAPVIIRVWQHKQADIFFMKKMTITVNGYSHL